MVMLFVGSIQLRIYCPMILFFKMHVIRPLPLVAVYAGFLLLASLCGSRLHAQVGAHTPEAKSAARSADYNWITQNIRSEHPRLFLNEGLIGPAKSRAQAEEAMLFERLKRRLDRILRGKNNVFKAEDFLDSSRVDDHGYGYRAAESAFIYLVTGEPRYLDFTKAMLEGLPQYYRERIDAGLPINWYSYSRISVLCAYDWIYPYLNEGERERLGCDLMSAFTAMLEGKGMIKVGGRNISDHRTGFYGVKNLYWFAGLTFYKLGIDDERAEKWLRTGFDDHLGLLEYRKEISAEQGGASTGAINYATGAYTWAEFNYFYTVKSATGHDAAQDWAYPVDALYYFHWNWLPQKYYFGYGDVFHYDNKSSDVNTHIFLSQMMHFYGDKRPEAMPLINFLMAGVPSPRSGFDLLPFIRFMLTTPEGYRDEEKIIKDAAPLENHPTAMLFENMGQVFMRSGFSEDDTYASFTAGGILSQHRHYDNNNFVIYKKNFLALDSGTRPEPGQHLTHYYCRTVAHNCILIRMPEENFPNYWGNYRSAASGETPMPVPNDGGQNKILGSEIIAYSQSLDYVYIASDATDSYHKDKAETVLRQFVYILPDVFVIFDKVESKDASYPKIWLLHTAAEPRMIAEDAFLAEFGEGRLFSRTVFPTKAKLNAIGGPGRQFWSDGRNWPLPVVEGQQPRDEMPLLGQWRVEVSPATKQAKDNFLHLIHVGGLSLDKMADSVAIEEDGRIGVQFDYAGKGYRIVFLTGKDHGGHITITEGDTVLKDGAFTTSVQKQVSPFLKK